MVPLPRAHDIKSEKQHFKQTLLKYSPDYFDSNVKTLATVKKLNSNIS